MGSRSLLAPSVALVAWFALLALALGRAAGFAPTTPAAVACFAVAGPIVLASMAFNVAAVWRGPRIVAFTPEDAVLCSAAEATALREAAQHRGSLGGAGHVHPGRLLIRAAASLAALTAGAQSLGDAAASALGSTVPVEIAATLDVWPVAVAAAAGVAVYLFPARRFFYRGAPGGRVLASPAAAVYAVLARARAAAPALDEAGEP